MILFRDRRDAGAVLAAQLTSAYAGRDDVVVLGLPRGGVPVAAEVAQRIEAPLDVLVVRKLGVPGHEELAMGAIGSGDVRVLDQGIIDRLGVAEHEVERVAGRELTELARREATYRGGRRPLDVAGRTVLLVDDGLATGASMRAAVLAVRRRGPAAVVAATPVGPVSTVSRLCELCDDVVVAATPSQFVAVGMHYADFTATTDAQVREALDAARRTV